MKKTILYVKTHNITGLKYFGKTTCKDPFEYRGSGKYWSRHIRKYGYDVTTEILGIFKDRIWLQLFSYEFSFINNIVESKDWANLKEENGLDGGWDSLNDGSIKHLDRCSKAGKKCHELHPELSNNLKKQTSENAKAVVKIVKEKHGKDFYKKIASIPCSEEKKEKLRIASLKSSSNGEGGKKNKGKVRLKHKCVYCEKEVPNNVLNRFHNENCKNKGSSANGKLQDSKSL